MKFIRKQKHELRSEVVTLKNEVDEVGDLLEQTILSIKEKDDEIDALRENKKKKGVLGRFGGGSAPPKSTIENLSKYTDEEIQELERICKLYKYPAAWGNNWNVRKKMIITNYKCYF